jgi:hypothetical protein
MSLKVIGTGFGRTGTDSMRTALEILGFGPCHHMRAVMSDEDQMAKWRAVAAGGAADWDSLLGGFGSCVDWPSAHYWPQLVTVYPDTKVILTWRTAESWWDSFEKTILARISSPGNSPESLGIALIKDKVFGGRPEDRAHAIATYEANVARVRAEVPPERLLIHEPGHGWEPLCAHLGVPVPDQPYPSANNAAAFRAEFIAKPDA